MSRESTLALCKELRSPVVILDILSWAKIVMHLQVRILTGSATQQEACQLQETSKLAAHVVFEEREGELWRKRKKVALRKMIKKWLVTFEVINNQNLML